MTTLALLLSVLLGVFQQGRAEPETHLIPEGYTGWVAIAFGAANGEALMHEGAARLYRIPRSGVLLIRGPRNEGFGPAYAFLVEGTGGARQAISYFGGGVADT